MMARCESCGAQYRIDDVKMGNKIRQFNCGKCHAAITVTPPGLKKHSGAETERKAEVSGRKKRVVVADDTAFFRTMLSDLLNDNGYETIQAKDGEDTLNKVMQELPDLDLLLLDMLMPKADGFEVIKKIKTAEAGKNLPILAVSGVFKSDEDRNLMKDLGISGYVDKNATPDEILRRVNLILNPDAVS